MRIASAEVSCLFSSPSFSVMMFCFSSDAEYFVFLLVFAPAFPATSPPSSAGLLIVSEPIGCLHRGFELCLEILFDVSARERVDNLSRPTCAFVLVYWITTMRVFGFSETRNPLLNAPRRAAALAESACRGSGERAEEGPPGFPPNSGILSRFNVRMTCKGQEITLEDVDFGVQVSGVVKLGAHVS